jgi:Bacterial Ig-like domain (group 2)
MFMLTGRKLVLELAFAVLVALAFGVSCRGFFPKPVLQSIAINPTAPQVNVGQTQSLQLFGTFDDGTRSQLTSGVGWSIVPTSVATITGTGSATLTGVTSGSATITASAQALSATANATVIGNVSSISVSPTSGSVTIGGSTGAPFTFAATPGPPLFITADNGGTLTITPADNFVTCTVSVDSNNNPDELCTAVQGANTTTPYQLVMTYPSSSGGTVSSTPTATLSVSP